MATKMNVSIDKMLAEAEAKVKTSLTEISTLIRKDFKEQARNSLAIFYEHYKPRIYDRTRNLFDNAINEDIEFDDFNLSDKNLYGGWVHFNADEMSEYDSGDKDAVLSNFMYGIHGRPSIYVEPIPAITLMNKFQKNYKTTLDKYFIERGFTVN